MTTTTRQTHNTTKKLQPIIGLREFRENTAAYIDAIAEGKEFTVVKRSKPIFKLVPVDEWGDEGNWVTVADFTDKKEFPNGVAAEDFLQALKNLEGKLDK